jgi:hypothetical protein
MFAHASPLRLNPWEHSLHTGGVAGSIPASPTIFPKWFQLLRGRPLPFLPPLDLEQNLKDASKPGEISGSVFAIRLQRRPERRPQSRQRLRLALIKEGTRTRGGEEASSPRSRPTARA